MMAAVDKADSAGFTMEEVLDPQGWVLLNFMMDAQLFRAQLARCTTVRGNLAVVDRRGEKAIHAGTRFMVYALHPEVNISMHVMWGRQKQNVVFAVGRSGGGHPNAGTCQVAHRDAARVQRALVDHITADG